MRKDKIGKSFFNLGFAPFKYGNCLYLKGLVHIMAINYQTENRIFTLNTKHTTYQMQVDHYGFLLHLYYGAKISGNMDYLLTYYDRGFSGNPADVGNDRTYSMDALPPSSM